MFTLKRHYKGLETEVAGLQFENPVGLCGPRAKASYLSGSGLGFFSLTPDYNNILGWLSALSSVRKDSTLPAVRLCKDISHSFALVYDFAGFIIIDPDNNEGIGAPDLADIHMLLDEILDLRLCYEGYTPILLNIPEGLSREEMDSCLDYCQLSGVNGFATGSLSTLSAVLEKTRSRMGVLYSARSQEDAAQALRQGAALVELSGSVLQARQLLRTLEKQAKKQK